MAREPVNVTEYEELAKQTLPKMYYDFYKGGAEDEHTLNENVQAFRRITLRPRILLDVTKIDTSTSIFGYKISSPVMIAPTAMHKLAHRDGEVATAKAAATCDTIMILSYSSSCTVKEVAASCNAVRFFQLYVFKRRDISALLVRRAESCGYKRRDISPNFYVDVRQQWDKGSNLEAGANENLDASLSSKDIGWLRSITKLPILIKGVLTSEDAIKAVEVGVDGIVVSNHGARQLDYSPATITVVEEIVEAVRGKVPVVLDGGVRRGTDVFKALALGAQAVLIGRPVVYGLAAKGEVGVKRVIEMLKDELELSMALSGCPSVKDISRSHVRTPNETLFSML